MARAFASGMGAPSYAPYAAALRLRVAPPPAGLGCAGRARDRAPGAWVGRDVHTARGPGRSLSLSCAKKVLKADGLHCSVRAAALKAVPSDFRPCAAVVYQLLGPTCFPLVRGDGPKRPRSPGQGGPQGVYGSGSRRARVSDLDRALPLTGGRFDSNLNPSPLRLCLARCVTHVGLEGKT